MGWQLQWVAALTFLSMGGYRWGTGSDKSLRIIWSSSLRVLAIKGFGGGGNTGVGGDGYH